MKRQWIVLVGFVAACLAVGAIGGASTASSVGTWYPTLRKPGWTPPAWVFGPVWTALYVLIGIAGWLVWRTTSRARRRTALVLWGVQLALNFLWSPLFFGLRSPALAALDITALWIALVAFVRVTTGVSSTAAWLFAPYFAWVTFAAALNFAVWWLNRGPN